MDDIFTLDLPNGQQYPYQVVHSKRAKYIRIKLSRQGDLSVTLPVFSKVSLAHEFIRSKSIWVEKNLLKTTVQTTNILPQTLNLRLLAQSWSVEYREFQASTKTILRLEEQAGQMLVLYGGTRHLNDFKLVAKIINNWCKKKAQDIFSTMLQELAESHGFHYQRLRIRAQKTRWGSCSSQKSISLNCKLLFMPEDVVKYVMIHELCHTLEMNHSSRFWRLVEECDPHYRSHKQQLKSLGKEITI